MTTLLSFLFDILGPYKVHGNGEHYFHCPFCHNSKPKFAINLNNTFWHCWHCNAKGKSVLTLARRLNLSKQQIANLKLLITPEELKRYSIYEKQTNTTLLLPSEYMPLWEPRASYQYKHAMNYLVKRGITAVDIIRYQMGYCETGKYAGRIIIPSFDENNVLNYFVGRDFWGNSKLKYSNPPTSKNVIVFENQINWNLPITLVEGVFDAIAVKQNAVPMLGKFMPSNLEKKILEKNVSEVKIFLDDDAQSYAMELANKLQNYGITVKNMTIKGKDAGEMSLEEIFNLAEQSSAPTFKSLLESKLS